MGPNSVRVAMMKTVVIARSISKLQIRYSYIDIFLANMDKKYRYYTDNTIDNISIFNTDILSLLSIFSVEYRYYRCGNFHYFCASTVTSFIGLVVLGLFSSVER